MRGLASSRGSLNLNKIASSYAEWFLSKPFDIGSTLRKSIPKACNMKQHQAEMMRRGASDTSQSNGCLMRISPLAVWSRNLTFDDCLKAVSEEVKLTHKNETVQMACGFYCVVIGQLLKGLGRREAYENTKNFFVGKSAELDQWVQEIELERCTVLTSKKKGWAKIAFVYSMRFLIAGFDYLSGIREMIKMGGDTDTNACIVGAVLGACDGIGGIPGDLVEKVREWEPKKGGIRRPKIVQVKHTWSLIEDLFNESPSSLNIIGN